MVWHNLYIICLQIIQRNVRKCENNLSLNLIKNTLFIIYSTYIYIFKIVKLPIKTATGNHNQDCMTFNQYSLT